MIEALAVLVALGLLFGVAYLLDRRRKKNREDASWMIPHQILDELFALHELRYVDPGIIPDELQEKGWASLTFQKELKGIRHADPSRVRKSLQQKGWEIKTIQIESSPKSITESIAHTILPFIGNRSSCMDVVHVILGADDRGTSVAKQSERVVVRWVDRRTASGEIERQFTDVWHDPTSTFRTDSCPELFDVLDKLPKQRARKLA